MQTLTIKTSSLTPDFKFDGISLEPQFPNIEKFYGIPAALHNVDKKFNTSTFRTVLEAAAPTLDVLVSDSSVQVLDPRSTFLNDDEFNQVIELAESISGTTATRSTNKFQKSATIKLQEKDSDSFLGDVFSRSWTITRRAEGGLSFSTDLLRQICSNGAIVKEKEFYTLLRRPDHANRSMLSVFATTADNLNVSDYLTSIFNREGSPVQASMADIYSMQDTLTKITGNKDLASVLYPTSVMEMFYESQGIDCKSLARKYLDYLPSGFTYWQAFCALTNGAKCSDGSIDSKIEVASYCSPQRIKNLKATRELHFEGMPVFSNAEIRLRMGDGKKTREEVIQSFR